MGAAGSGDLGSRERLEALDKAGLREDIMAMRKFDLGDPAQAVAAQEKLNALLPKISKAFADAGITPLRDGIGKLVYRDQNSGETIQTGPTRPGGVAALNDVINGFASLVPRNAQPTMVGHPSGPTRR
jgi:hypothetical protein